MIHVFGNFSEEARPCQEYLTLVFSPTAMPIKKRWAQNGLSADFLAEYFGVFFLGSEDSNTGSNRQSEVKSAVSYIANELLENAMKFHDDRQRYNVSLTLQLHPNQLVFFTRNSVKPETVGEFKFFIQELLANDPGELYIRKVEESAVEKNSPKSRLGFLTMMNDYLAKIGWKFETVQQNPETIALTTMVQLEV